MNQYLRGNLIIKPLCAELYHERDIYGRMDPYVKVTLGAQTFKTRTANNQPVNPKWGDALEFRVTSEKEASVSLWDKDTGSRDDFLGETKIPITPVILSKEPVSDWFPINRKDKCTGRVLVSFEFFPQKQQGYAIE